MTEPAPWPAPSSIPPPPPTGPVFVAPAPITTSSMSPAVPIGIVRSRRVTAALLDLIPLTVLAIGLGERASTDAGARWQLSGWRLLLDLLVVVGYYVGTEMLIGTTPGKWVLGLRVVDAEGNRPERRAFVLRNGFRFIDGLPVAYLVGFIVLNTTAERQRVGDLVAKTFVVRRSRSVDPAATPTTRRTATVAASAVAAVLVVSAFGFANKPVRSEAVGRLDYVDDVVPFVNDLGDDVFRPGSADAFAGVFLRDAVTHDAAAASLEQLRGYAGELVGEYIIEEHEVLPDSQVPGFGRFDLVQVRVRAGYARGVGDLYLAIVDDDGEPRLVRWDLTLRT